MFRKEMLEKIQKVEQKITAKRLEIQETALFNQEKVLKAFQNESVAATDLIASNGYGYDDIGRDKLDRIYANVFGSEKAFVRPQLISGTHAIATALFGVLKPGDELLYITDQPYDTLLEVIGLTGSGVGSMKSLGIEFDFVSMKRGRVDLPLVREKISPKTKVIAIQRSRGYSGRPSLTVEEIEQIVKEIRSYNQDVILFCDNCYGEFSEEREPTEVGIDLMAGSLIKNPGGGIAKTGGYIAGKAEYVDAAAARLTIPGVGSEGGAMGSNLYDFMQGFFLAPHIVSQAIQGAVFASALFEEFHLFTTPKWDEKRTDLIQTVEFGEVESMVSFCKVVQKYSPIDSHITPYPSPMLGYVDDIIMAAGAFVEGSTIEFSADGPVRPPYRVFMQGGLTYEHVKLAVTHAMEEIYLSK
jgi:cystathionine beta-lyase family protein involved in aluminum resistance